MKEKYADADSVPSLITLPQAMMRLGRRPKFPSFVFYTPGNMWLAKYPFNQGQFYGYTPYCYENTVLRFLLITFKLEKLWVKSSSEFLPRATFSLLLLFPSYLLFYVSEQPDPVLRLVIVTHIMTKLEKNIGQTKNPMCCRPPLPHH